MSPAEYLEGKGWSEAAAAGIVAHLDLSSTRGMVPAHRWDLFCDWASASERNREHTTSALAFLDYEMRNSFDGLGRDLAKATSVEAAAAEVAPYFGRDKERFQNLTEVRFLSLEEAKASGYVDPGNRELTNAPG